MLSEILLESAGRAGFGGYSGKYDADDGAYMIAQESAAELYSIFENELMPIEECEFRTCVAAMEGATPLSDAVMEGIGETIKTKAKAAWTRIKEFFKKLKAKVVDFGKAIKMHFMALIKNGTEFASKYESDLDAKDSHLKGFKFTMYNYDIAACSQKLETFGKDFEENIKKEVEDKLNKINVVDTVDDKGTDGHDALKSELDALYETSLKTFFGSSFNLTDDTDVSKLAWSTLRSGATGKHDMQLVTITSTKEYRTRLSNAKSNYDSVTKALDNVAKGYDAAINLINTAEKTHEGKDTETKALSLCKLYASAISKSQTAYNTILTAYKNAYTEMIKTYKTLCVKALSYKEPK